MLTKHQIIYRANREKQIARVKSYYWANRGKVLAQKKARYKKHPRMMRQRATSWYSRNREKVRAYRRTEHYRALSRTYNAKRKVQIRNFWLKQQYGMTVQDYEAILTAQGGVCAICGRVETSKNKHGQASQNLAVDHCHNTKKVRGLLCRKCNQVLGLMHERVDWLQKALDYLTRPLCP